MERMGSTKPGGEARADGRSSPDVLQKLVEECLALNAGAEDASFGRAFCSIALEAFWKERTRSCGSKRAFPSHPFAAPCLSAEAVVCAHAVGGAAAALPFDVGAYTLSSLYVRTLPDILRTQYGMFFKPPPVVGRLLDMVAECGFDWANGRILDPACGGGAFLAPVARRMIQSALAAGPRARPADVAHDICNRLHGIEIESFCSWMARVFLELTLLEHLGDAGGVTEAVRTADTIAEARALAGQFELIIGNPPYGRVRLPPVLRERFARSLFGHANLYGIFTDMAVRMATDNRWPLAGPVPGAVFSSF